MGAKWVYTTKQDASGKVTRYKARLVVLGNQDSSEYTDAQLFAPTAHLFTLRVVLTLAAAKDWPIWQFDVSRAFLNGRLPEDSKLLMRQPKGFEDKDRPFAQCLLRGSLYGLKTAPAIWHREVVNFFVNQLGLVQSLADPCVFISKDSNGSTIALVLVYVDDMIVAGDLSELRRIREQLTAKWIVTGAEDVSTILGIKTTRRDKSIYLSQQQYIEDAVKELGMDGLRPRSTPMEVSNGLRSSDLDEPVSDKDVVDKGRYLTAMGKLLYVMRATRPDLAYACSRLAHFCQRPGVRQWAAMVHVYRYLYATRHYGLCLKGSSVFDSDGVIVVCAYTDANYAAEKVSSRSTSGCIVRVGEAAVDWASNLQHLPAWSTAEAEYEALAAGARDVVGVVRMIQDFGFQVQLPPRLNCDNLAALKQAETTVYSRKTRHIRLTLHFVREYCSSGLVKVVYCPTDHMIADVLTKPLSRLPHRDALRALGLMSVDTCLQDLRT